MSVDPGPLGNPSQPAKVGADDATNASPAQLLAAIGRLGQIAVNDNLSLHHALRTANETAIELMGIDRVSVWRLQDDGAIHLIERTGAYEEIGASTTSKIPAQEFRLPKSFLTDPIVAFDDLDYAPKNYRPIAEILRRYGLRSAVVARIWVDGVVNGAMVMSHLDYPHRWSDTETSAAEAFASLAGRWLEAAARHQVERDLDRQRRRMADFVDIASDCYWETDDRHRFTFLSDGAKDIFGLPAARLVGRPLVGSLNGTGGQAAHSPAELLSAMAARKPLRDIVLPLPRRGDSARTVRLNAKPVLADNGTFLGYRGAAKDITALLANDRRLRDHLAGTEQLTPMNDHGSIDLNRVFRDAVRLAAQSIDGICPSLWLWDARQRILQCVAMYDCAQDRFVDVGVVQHDRINPIAHTPYFHGVSVQNSPDVTTNSALPEGLVKLLTERGIRSLLDAMLWRDNGLVAVLGIGHGTPHHPWSASEQLVLENLASHVLRSLEAHELQVTRSALRHSEARFRDFADFASDWFWETGRDHKLTYISDQHRTATGTRASEILGRTRWNIDADPSDETDWRRHWASLSRRQSFRDFRYWSTAPDGRRRRVSISGKPVFAESGEFLGYRGSGRDCTQDELAIPAPWDDADLYRTALEECPCALQIFDNRRRVAFRNRAYRERVDTRYGINTLGMRLEDLLETLIDVGHIPDAVGREEEWVREWLRVHDLAEASMTLLCGADGEHQLELHHRRLSGGGALELHVEQTRDKEGLDDLRTSEARYRDVVSAGNDWIWETDAEHRFTHVAPLSEEAASLIDFGVIGRTRWDNADIDNTGFEWRRHIADINAQRAFRDFRYDRHLPDGRVVGVVSSGVPHYDRSGTFLGYRGTGRAVREDPSASGAGFQFGDLLNRSLDQLPAGIAVCAADGRIAHCNPRFHYFCRELIAVDPTRIDFDSLCERLIQRSRPEHRFGIDRDQLRRRLRQRRTERQGYVSFYFGPGHHRHVDMVVFPAPGEHFLICLHDSTRETEHAWEAERAMRLRALTQPLARISSLLADVFASIDDTQSDLQPAARAVRKTADRLAMLARMQEPRPRRLDLSDWLVRFAARPPDGAPPHLHLEVLRDPGPLYCRFDPDHLAIALCEILSNSVEACGSAATVTLHLRHPPAAEQQGACARLSVMDSGPGFDAAMIERAPAPFVTSHTDSKARGLGLTIAACCAQGNGGYLAVSNRDGAGATVEIGLPLTTEADDRPATAAD